MDKWITCQLAGGLGNQLFMIFNAISYSLNTERKLWFMYQPVFNSTTIRYPYWNSFFEELKSCLYSRTPQELEDKERHNITEEYFHYNDIPKNINPQNVWLNGYFQSYKYFDSNYDYIYQMLNIENKKHKVKSKTIILDKNNDIVDLTNNDIITISIHFRLGDYKKYPTIHPILQVSYYIYALSTILQNLKDSYKNKKIYAVYFYEKNEEDSRHIQGLIEECKHIYKNIEFIDIHTISNVLQDYEELLLMSCFQNNIIANSSFSWFSAYLNNNKDKIVVYPKKWFGHGCSHNTKDMCPPSWFSI